VSAKKPAVQAVAQADTGALVFNKKYDGPLQPWQSLLLGPVQRVQAGLQALQLFVVLCFVLYYLFYIHIFFNFIMLNK
jgi:hypothetical protein